MKMQSHHHEMGSYCHDFSEIHSAVKTGANNFAGCFFASFIVVFCEGGGQF